jgi:hypothetical protein
MMLERPRVSSMLLRRPFIGVVRFPGILLLAQWSGLQLLGNVKSIDLAARGGVVRSAHSGVSAGPHAAWTDLA